MSASLSLFSAAAVFAAAVFVASVVVSAHDHDLEFSWKTLGVVNEVLVAVHLDEASKARTVERLGRHWLAVH
jgi:hypothetical protein